MGASDKAVAEKAAQAEQAFNLLGASWPYPQPVNIHQRIMLIMRECTYIQKEDKNKSQGMRFDFVSYDAVAAKIHPLLTKYGVLIFPTLVEHKVDGNRVEATYDIAFCNVDDPSDQFISRQLSFGVDTQDKGPGKACTYSVKTALLRTFCLEAGRGEDPDANQGPESDHRPATINDQQLADLEALADEVGANIPAFCKFLKIQDLGDLLAADYQRAVAALESKRKVTKNQNKDNGNG